MLYSFVVEVERAEGKTEVWKRMSLNTGVEIVAKALAENDGDVDAASEAMLRELGALNRRG